MVALQDSVELPMHQYISITADRRRKVGVHGDIESIVSVLGDVEHAGAEVLRALRSPVQKDVDNATGTGVVDAPSKRMRAPDEEKSIL